MPQKVTFVSTIKTIFQNISDWIDRYTIHGLSTYHKLWILWSFIWLHSMSNQFGWLHVCPNFPVVMKSLACSQFTKLLCNFIYRLDNIIIRSVRIWINLSEKSFPSQRFCWKIEIWFWNLEGCFWSTVRTWLSVHQTVHCTIAVTRVKYMIIMLWFWCYDSDAITLKLWFSQASNF